MGSICGLSSIRGYQEIQESLVPDGPGYIDSFDPHLATFPARWIVATPRDREEGPSCTSRRPASRNLWGTGVRVTHLRLDPVRPEPARGHYQIDSVAGSPQQSDSSRRGYGWNRAKTDRRAGRPIGIGCDDGSPGYPLRLADATPSTAPGRRTAHRDSTK